MKDVGRGNLIKLPLNVVLAQVYCRIIPNQTRLLAWTKTKSKTVWKRSACKVCMHSSIIHQHTDDAQFRKESRNGDMGWKVSKYLNTKTKCCCRSKQRENSAEVTTLLGPHKKSICIDILLCFSWSLKYQKEICWLVFWNEKWLDMI